MKDFCENQYCDSPGAKVVPVSVARPSDQERTLCIPCEEAYTWGVQHGTMAAHATQFPLHLDRFLKKDGFVILTRNDGDPSRHGSFEAWAYRGPLDLNAATPVTFGVGDHPQDALAALDAQLDVRHPRDGSGKAEDGCQTDDVISVHLTRRELATVLAALRFHQDENLQDDRTIPDAAIDDIATDAGALLPLDFREVDRLCEELNCGHGVRAQENPTKKGATP